MNAGLNPEDHVVLDERQRRLKQQEADARREEFLRKKKKASARERDMKERIEALTQELRLADARLEAELFRRGGGAPCVEPSDPEDPIAAKWGEDHLTLFGDELFSVLLLASREAARLGRTEFDVDAVFLGFFVSPEVRELFRSGLPPGLDADAARAAMEASIQSGPATATLPKQLGPDLPLTKTLRLLLEAVEAERERLDNAVATPGHLLLVLTSEEFLDSGAFDALEVLDVDPSQLRLAALESLGDFLAIAQRDAEAWLAQRCADSVAVASARPTGQCVAGLSEAYAAITDGLMERSVEAKLLLLAALTGEHLFLLGAPGTAKSLVARRLANVCAGTYFERLLTRFSVPEELFGPLSLQALEQDELRRKTRGFLPEADVAFIDEIFKANSSILNTLLQILNERFFDNGETRMRVKLWCTVAASNELPDTDELDALYDRFLLRRYVRRISPQAVPRYLRLALDVEDAEDEVEEAKPSDSSGAAVSSLLSAASSAELQARAREVEFPDRLLQVVAELREYLAEEAEPPYAVTDRRLGKAVRLIRVAAAVVGAPKVVEADLLLLQHIFWDRTPQQGELVAQWLLQRFAEDSSTAAWKFLLEGLRKRLRAGPDGPALAAVQRELASVRQAATTALDVALQVAQDAPDEPGQDSEGLVDRFFWLSAEECREAASVGRQAAEGAAILGRLLVEAAVLAKVAGVEDAPRREELMGVVLRGAEVAEPREVKRDDWGDPI